MNKNLILAGSIILAIILLGGCAEKMPQERVEAPETQPPPISEDSRKEGKIGGLDKEQKILSFDMTGYTKDGKKKWDSHDHHRHNNHSPHRGAFGRGLPAR